MINKEHHGYIGTRIPLYTPDQIAKMSKKRRKKKKTPSATQPNLLVKEPINANNLTRFPEHIDPEKKIMQVGAELEKRFRQKRNSVIDAEIKEKRLKLRTQIDLTIARGNDPRVGDKFYKSLVKLIYTQDIFEIFLENDHVRGEQPEELKLKIAQIKELINHLLSLDLNNTQKTKIFYQFFYEYENKWQIS